MKIAIMYDNAGYFAGSKSVADDYVLANNETFLIPDNSLLNPRFNGNSWIGSSQEEFNRATINTAGINNPSLEGMVQQLGTTVAQLSIALNGIEQQLKMNGGNSNGQA